MRAFTHTSLSSPLCVSKLTCLFPLTRLSAAVCCRTCPLTPSTMMLMFNHYAANPQDWSYIAVNCTEITVELSTKKGVDPSKLAHMWRVTMNALLAYPIASALGGVYGTTLGTATASESDQAPYPYQQSSPLMASAGGRLLSMLTETLPMAPITGPWVRAATPFEQATLATALSVQQ